MYRCENATARNIKGSWSRRRKMIPDENSIPRKGGGGTRNDRFVGKYETFFFLSNLLKYSDLFIKNNHHMLLGLEHVPK